MMLTNNLLHDIKISLSNCLITSLKLLHNHITVYFIASEWHKKIPTPGCRKIVINWAADRNLNPKIYFPTRMNGKLFQFHNYMFPGYMLQHKPGTYLNEDCRPGLRNLGYY
jgi:hypothetical protein